jgi:hypothetical protein
MRARTSAESPLGSKEVGRSPATSSPLALDLTSRHAGGTKGKPFRCGSRSAFCAGEFEQRLHCRLPWLKLDDVDGLRRCAEREPTVGPCGAADDDDPATGPPGPDAGGHDHMHAARVDERQPSKLSAHLRK